MKTNQGHCLRGLHPVSEVQNDPKQFILCYLRINVSYSASMEVTVLQYTAL